MSRRFDHDLDELRDALAFDAEGVVRALGYGEPNRLRTRGHTVRWGRQGSLKVDISGPHRGTFKNFETGDGGDMLALIRATLGCGFPEAVEWARRHAGISAPDHGRDARDREAAEARRRADQAARDAQRAAEAEADQGRRRADAGRLWNGRTPLAGTIGETYLASRSIHPPAEGWPDRVAFHPDTQSLIVVATTDDGDKGCAVQRVRLTAEGRKAPATEDSPTKISNGVPTGGAVRLPGDPAGPLLLAEGPETGLSVWTATGHETRVSLGSIANLKPPAGRTIIVCRDDDAPASAAAKRLNDAITTWRAEGVDVRVATPWASPRGDRSDFNDVLQDGGPEAVRARIAAALAATDVLPAEPEPAEPIKPPAPVAELPPGPHFPRPRLTGEAASRRLRRFVAAWFDRVELILECRDWIEAETERLRAEMTQAEISRIADQFVAAGTAADQVATEADKAAARLARQRARRAAARRFGRKVAAGKMPRRLIAGSAGLGKTSAVIAEYVRRPALWRRHIVVYTKTLDLADEFAADVSNAAANLVAPGGSRPRAFVIRGRLAKGMCDPGRRDIVHRAQERVASLHRACCHAPAAGKAPESFCPMWQWCTEQGYVAQFMDRGPALRVLAHARLPHGQPDDLRLPAPDIVIVDESAIGTLTDSAIVDPSALTDAASYAAKPGEEHLVQEAMDIGAAVAAALAGQDAVATLRLNKVRAKHLRAAAEAARLAHALSWPIVWPGLEPTQAKERLNSHRRHPGRDIAGVLEQLARDVEIGRSISYGVELDTKNVVRLPDGSTAPHPIIRHHSTRPAISIPHSAALLLLDADGDLAINRRLFGEDVRGITITAKRVAHVTQVSDATLATSTLTVTNRGSYDAKLRARIGEFVRGQSAGGKLVLVVAALPVRRALTGEPDDEKPEPWTNWNGAEITHFGRHLGANRWRDFDTVIVIGREELPAIEAERIARAIWGDAEGVTLDLPGDYERGVLRRHDVRDGTAEPVKVRVHPDPKVQAIIEIHRERAMGQGADRLRLIHREASNEGKVFVLSSLPVPGLTVDRLLPKDDVLAGGTVWDRAIARMPGGVLPLSADWLTANPALSDDLFPSRRTAEREIAELVKTAKTQIGFPIRVLAVYRLAGQRRPSRALVRADVADPRGELARLLGAEVVAFELERAAVAAATVAPELPEPAPEDEPVAPTIPLDDPGDLAPCIYRLDAGRRMGDVPVDVLRIAGKFRLMQSGFRGRPPGAPATEAVAMSPEMAAEVARVLGRPA